VLNIGIYRGSVRSRCAASTEIFFHTDGLAWNDIGCASFQRIPLAGVADSGLLGHRLFDIRKLPFINPSNDCVEVAGKSYDVFPLGFVVMLYGITPVAAIDKPEALGVRHGLPGRLG
jgi:hypothetical protein